MLLHSKKPPDSKLCEDFIDITEYTKAINKIIHTLFHFSLQEIALIGDKRIIVRNKNGIISQLPSPFKTNEGALRGIQNFVFSIGLHLTPVDPFIGGKIPGYNGRFQALIPPLSPEGAILIFRRFDWEFLDLESFVNAHKLKICVGLKQPVIIFGPAGTGKTTLMHLLLKTYCMNERLVILDESMEAECQSGFWTHLSQTSSLTYKELISISLKCSPERIVIGECKQSDIEFFCRLLLLGHAPPITTMHASSIEDMINQIRIYSEEGIYNSIKGRNCVAIQLKRTNTGRPAVIDAKELTL